MPRYYENNKNIFPFFHVLLWLVSLSSSWMPLRQIDKNPSSIIPVSTRTYLHICMEKENPSTKFREVLMINKVPNFSESGWRERILGLMSIWAINRSNGKKSFATSLSLWCIHFQQKSLYSYACFCLTFATFIHICIIIISPIFFAIIIM